jgi:hypothetical protein
MARALGKALKLLEDFFLLLGAVGIIKLQVQSLE